MLDKLHCYWILIFFTNGVIIQWGYNIGNRNVNFPISFADYCIVVGAVRDVGDVCICGTSIDLITLSYFYSTTGYNNIKYDQEIYWFAIGY